MAKNDWSGAEQFGVGVLAGCLAEKLQNIISLITAAEQLLSYVEKTNPKAAALFKSRIEKARDELLTKTKD